MAALPDDWALPALNAFNREWFTSGTLAVQRCRACATLQHPPEEICHACHGMAFDTQRLSGRGVVHSYTIVHHAVHPALASSVPYAVVLVALAEAPHLRVVGNLPDVAVDHVRIGLPVVATWETRHADGDDLLLLQWVPA